MKSIWNYTDCGSHGNALLKISPETPQTANAAEIKAGLIRSDSQGPHHRSPSQGWSTTAPLPWFVSRAHLLIPSLILPTVFLPGVTLSGSSLVFFLCNHGSVPFPCLSPLIMERFSQPPKCSRRGWLLRHFGPSPSTDQVDALSGFAWPLRVIQESSYLKIAPSNSTNRLPVEEI